MYKFIEITNKIMQEKDINISSVQYSTFEGTLILKAHYYVPSVEKNKYLEKTFQYSFYDNRLKFPDKMLKTEFNIFLNKVIKEESKNE